MWLGIYLDITRDNSIESINGINVIYQKEISKLTYDNRSSLVRLYVKGGSIRWFLLTVVKT